MVIITPFLGATLLISGMASALPAGDGGSVASQSTTATATVATDASSNGYSSVAAYGSSSDSSYGSYGADSNGYSSVAAYGSSSDSSYGSYGADSYSSASTLAASTSSAAWSYSTPLYGSGASSWGGSGYDSCVAQCLSQYGTPDSAYMPTSTTQDEGSTGTGATHTIIVAPSQGVLRYVPFAVNASVGDTIKFMWGADNHTVTKSSQLTPCNKTSDALFASGTQNKGFVFTQAVNDTNPVFFYCGTPGHCQQGMFGIINPPNDFGSATSVSASMQSIGANNSNIAAYASYTSNKTTNSLAASKWGGSINLSALPEWAHAAVAENVLYTRNFLASNPEVLKEDGTIDLSSAASTPLMIPQDVGADLNNLNNLDNTNNVNSTVVSSSTGTSSATSEPAATSQTTNSAGSLALPRALVTFFIVVATFLTL